MSVIPFSVMSVTSNTSGIRVKTRNLQITCNNLYRMLKVKYPFLVIPVTDCVLMKSCTLTLSLDVTISTLITISLVVGYKKNKINKKRQIVTCSIPFDLSLLPLDPSCSKAGYTNHCINHDQLTSAGWFNDTC